MQRYAARWGKAARVVMEPALDQPSHYQNGDELVSLQCPILDIFDSLYALLSLSPSVSPHGQARWIMSALLGC
jgi:hypothetical protein